MVLGLILHILLAFAMMILCIIDMTETYKEFNKNTEGALTFFTIFTVLFTIVTLLFVSGIFKLYCIYVVG